MLRHITPACIFAIALLAPQAQAQCPAGNPLQTLQGTWTFSTEGFNFPPTNFLASAGRFTALIVPPGPRDGIGLPTGQLTVTQTSLPDGSGSRYATDTGKYQVNADCTGGTLNFNSGGRADQFDFYFSGPDEIVFVGTNNADIVTGSAKRVSAGLVNPVCPANPLTALSGTWTFRSDGFNFPPTMFLASVGRFTASLGFTPAPNVFQIGLLNVIQSGAIDGSPIRQEVDFGRYQIFPDCSGGTLTIPGNRPYQYDFWFNAPDSIVFVGSGQGDIVEGTAKRVL